MISFYLQAVPMMNGQIVELRAFTGTKKNRGAPMGSWTLQREEWELMRVLLIAGIKNSRIPTELLDQTRRKLTSPLN